MSEDTVIYVCPVCQVQGPGMPGVACSGSFLDQHHPSSVPMVPLEDADDAGEKR